MRISLDQLNSQALSFELPGASGGAGKRVSIHSFLGLRGTLVTEGGALTVSKLGVERAALDALRLVFGTVTLGAEGDSLFTEVSGGLRRDDDGLDLDVRAKGVEAADFHLDVGSVHLRSALTIAQMRLRQSEEGILDGKRAELENFRMKLGALEVRADEACLSGVHLGWGGTGFWIEFAHLEASVVRISTELGTFAVKGLSIRNLSFRGGRITARKVGIEKVEGSLDLAPSTKPKRRARKASPADTKPLFDLALLDGLTGEVHVDVGVDLTVPVIGRRRATHRLRIPVDHGTIDYMKLEGDLSTLESNLLDFSLRERALVLERGIPLLPTRGRGKPILVWELDAADYALAEKRRVRLSVLPKAKPFRDPNEESTGGKEETASKSKLALRELTLRPLRLRMRLAPRELEGALRKLAFESFELSGNVIHPRKDETTDEGWLRAHFSGLKVVVADVPVGTGVLRQGRLRVGVVEDIDVRLDGLRPRTGKMKMRELALDELDFALPV